MSKLLLAIDPGTKKCGYALYEILDKGNVVFKTAGTLVRANSKPLYTLADALSMWIQNVAMHGGEIVIEGYAYSSEMREFALPELVGIIKYFCEKHGLTYSFIQNGTWKKTLTGRGDCSHDAYRLAAAELVEKELTAKDEDQAAAIGIGYHFLIEKEYMRKGQLKLNT